MFQVEHFDTDTPVARFVTSGEMQISIGKI